MEKIVIGLVENLIFLIGNKRHSIQAKVDTGATKSSIDIKLANDLKLGPVVGNRIFKSAHGIKRRSIIAADVELAEKKLYKVQFSIIDRSHMQYPILIGQNILKKGFLIDITKGMEK